MRCSLKKMIGRLYHLGDIYRPEDFAAFGNDTFLPQNLTISNPRNIYLGNHVQIGENAILFATNAKIIVKDYFVSADSLKIATGMHERRLGCYCGSITEETKNHNIGLDKDVIINEDVWAGFQVTILSGVEIGRGCTLAAGSVVTKSTPPYSVIGGCPAKFIKFYWTIDEILADEAKLYPLSQRFSKDYLDLLFQTYK